MQKMRNVKKDKSAVRIDGLEEFPLETVGLTVGSIERADGHIKIPIELIPFLKICRNPAITRKKKAEQQHRYLLRVKRKKREKHRPKRRLSS